MSSELISLSQLAAVTKEAGGIIASAWSEAAKSYQKKVANAEATKLLTEAEKQKILAGELCAKMEQAEALKDTVLF
jgi:hypothetical protein